MGPMTRSEATNVYARIHKTTLPPLFANYEIHAEDAYCGGGKSKMGNTYYVQDCAAECERQGSACAFFNFDSRKPWYGCTTYASCDKLYKFTPRSSSQKTVYRRMTTTTTLTSTTTKTTTTAETTSTTTTIITTTTTTVTTATTTSTTTITTKDCSVHLDQQIKLLETSMQSMITSLRQSITNLAAANLGTDELVKEADALEAAMRATC